MARTARSKLTGMTLATLAAGWLLGVAGAAEEARERHISAAMTYPGITIGPDDRISVDLVVNNSGGTDETVLLSVEEKPEGWKAQIKGYSQTVSGVFVAAGKDRSLTFSAEPEDEEVKKLPAGTHRFAVKAQTPDGEWTATTTLDVTVLEKEKVPEAIELDIELPELRGASDTDFLFSLDVRNESDEDAVFNLKATAPPGWEVSFKPAYEQKQISALQIEADQSKTVEIQAKPPYNATAGEYPFTVNVSSPTAGASTELKVVLTGTYEIEARTTTGLLSLTTQRAKEATVSLLVANNGSAPQNEITFVDFKPDNWKVKFEPEKIAGLEPGSFQQVEATMTPAEEALVGDYLVLIRVDGEKATDDVELRVTVKASTRWAWVGVGIIVLVILGLAATFAILGRR